MGGGILPTASMLFSIDSILISIASFLSSDTGGGATPYEQLSVCRESASVGVVSDLIDARIDEVVGRGLDEIE